ncbi:MAG: hypothetical protein WBW58_12780, partial [Candidatus Acidiferrum sp.]
DETVDECSAVMQFGIHILVEKSLEHCALLLKLLNLSKNACRFGAHLGIGLAGQVNVPAQAHEHDDSGKTEKARTG